MELLDDHPDVYLDTAFTFDPGVTGAFDLDPAWTGNPADEGDVTSRVGLPVQHVDDGLKQQEEVADVLVA